MPVRIRLSRKGAKKRPSYRIVVADSRRARDGKFIDQIGTYNPMLPKNDPERVKVDSDKAKEWLQKGAQPSDRVKLFLSKLELIEKPIITEKTKQHLPKKKTQEKLEKAKKAAAAPVAKEETKEETKEAAPVAKEETKEETKEAAPAAKEETKSPN